MTYLYVHICADRQSADSELTVRIPFIAEERADELALRIADQCNNEIPAAISQLLAAGGYELRPGNDSNPPLKVNDKISTLPPCGDIFATFAPPICIYVNSSDVDGVPDVTARLPSVLNGVTTFQQILQKFCEAASVDIERGLLELAISLDGSTAVSSSNSVVSGLADKQDLFVVRVEKAAPRVSQKVSLVHPLAHLAKQEIDKIMAIARELQNKQQLAQARILLCELLNKLEPDDSTSSARAVALCLIGDLEAAAKLYHNAAEDYKRAIDLLPLPQQPPILRLLGIALHNANNYSSAYNAFNTCLEVSSRCGASLAPAQVVEVKIRLGAAMFMSGLVDQGIAIVQETLGGDTTNDLGVYWMSRFFLSKNFYRDALAWAVQLLVKNSKDPQRRTIYKENVAAMMASIPDSFDLLRSILDGERTTPKKEIVTAWGFFGVVCKDFGLLDIALKIFRYASTLKVESARAGLTLDHAHVLETMSRPMEGLILIKAFLSGHKITIGGIETHRVAEMIGDIVQLDRQFPVRPTSILSRINATRNRIRCVDSHETLQVFPASDEFTPPIRASTGNGAEQTRQEFDQGQLEVLGIIFASVKDLFLLGLLDRCIPILQLANPPRARNAIHRTLMRNEAAYFSSVGLILQHHDQDPERPITNFDAVMYVVGDSHVLSCAWKVITIQGRKTMLVPALVTGIKLWHLRGESVFYPKKQFEAVTDSIPAGADVLLILGEIDCREGIAPSVEKGIYPTAVAAMNYLAQVYIEVVTRLQRKFGRIFVHQPPAVIDVTRHIVLQFHDVLANALGPYSDQFHLLDPIVLNEQRTGVLPEFCLDQTHLSPAYVHQALEPCINGALSDEPPPLSADN